MKKSVILAILAVYIAAIVAVGLLGIKMAVYNEIKYVTAIRLVDSKDGAYTIRHASSEPDIDYIRLEYSEGLMFQIYYEVDPVDATNKTVNFDFNLDGKEAYIDISNEGVVTVKANPSGRFITVDGYIRANDGSRIRSRKIRIQIDRKS